ncbi:MAG: SusD/RagB family nutrient-binding outer membrane lipoprotein [Sphingobacteriales bacterium]|nr:MAG: SusD/RagB family nutrient-binding outer membrane lipoprotein [Sphingobacteriales bacterium]
MRKSNILIVSALLSGLLFTATGCKKFLDVNKTPNNLTFTKADWVMTGALGTSMRIQYGGSHIVLGTWTGMYAHSTSFTGGGNEKTYSFTNSDFNFFNEAYDNLQDYQYVIQNADKDGVGFWKDPADVMQCLVFQRLVDMYGDVPYTEAFQGVNNISPKYDKQKDIYEDLIKRLDKDIANMKAATWPLSGDFTKQDIFFALNKTNWIKFANTIKLRILMRQSFMPGRDSYISSNILTTVGEGYISTNVLCKPGYQNIAGKLNPFYSTYGYNEVGNVLGNHQYRKMNRVIINWLKTSSLDTFRLQSLAWPSGSTPTAPLPTAPPSPNSLSAYVGVPLGVGSGFSTAGSSPIGPFQIVRGTSTRPAIFMTAAESYLLQAEAVLRYPAVATAIGVSAQTLYETGILTHFRLCADPTQETPAANQGDAAYNRYINRPINNVNWAVTTDHIRGVLIQKWVALVHVNGLEAWSEYRKSSGSTTTPTYYGLPSTPLSVVASSPDEPVRLFYPLNEENTNGNNVPKGIDVFTSKIFWDVN